MKGNLYFFSVVLQQSRRVCDTLQSWARVGEHRENQKDKGWPCWLPKADIMWTGYLSRIRKRENMDIWGTIEKFFFCRNASNVQCRRHISTKWNVEVGLHHILEGMLSKRKGKSKGKILLLLNIERMEDKWQRGRNS